MLSGCFEQSTEPEPVDPPVAIPGESASLTSEGASRMLSMATFGPDMDDIDDMVAMGTSDWMTAQFAMPQDSLLQEVLQAELEGEDVRTEELAEAFWTNAILADDQLRQRVGYALSQIFVASFRDGNLARRPFAMANYMDIMNAGAFGNFRQLIENITYSPAMGIYLTYLQNQRASDDGLVVPDENYAREIMQLFTIGLIELNPDGTPRLDGSGNEIETYDNVDVTELAKVFTGLSWGGRDRFFGNPNSFEQEYLPMEMYDDQHSSEAKAFLGVVIPEDTAGVESIRIALDTLFNHGNTAPFISRQLIQRLVTSNPSPAYVERVATAFSTGSFILPDGGDAGSGERGDMRAVVAAILLDPEATNSAAAAASDFGKIREPVLRFTHWARAFDVTGTELDDLFELRDTGGSDRLAQAPYQSPSVFNFYRPGFVAPGSVTSANGLVAPELQITSESSITGYSNFMLRYITQRVPGENFRADYTEELALANDPAALVDRLDMILTYGMLSDVDRQTIIDVLESTISNDPQEQAMARVYLALLFFYTSLDYLVQR